MNKPLPQNEIKKYTYINGLKDKIVKIVIIPKLIYRFTAITIKIPIGPLHPNWSLTSYEDAKDKAKQS